MASPTRVSRGGTGRRGRILGAAVLVVVLVAVLGVALVALGALVPSLGALGAAASLAVPGEGPALVLVALVAAVVAWATRPLVGRVASGVAVLALLAGLALAGVVGALVAVTVQHGGAVDLVRAVLPGSEASAAVDERPVYLTTADGEQLHLALVRPAVPAGRPAPIMVWVHGGGWVGGSDLGRAADMRRFADRGWLAVSVEYSLARPGRPTWDVAGPQVACALRRVGDGALGGDRSSIVLGGDSAGGQLAVSVAYHAAAGDQVSACGGPVPVPRAVATDYPAVDLVAGYEHGARSAEPGLDAPSLAVGYTGGTPAQVPDRYRAVSGAAAITPAAPPTLVIAPARDALVPPDSLASFVRAARGAGVDATLVSLPFANHAYDTYGDGSLGQQVGFSIIEQWAAERANR